MARTQSGPRYKVYSVIRYQPHAPGPKTSRFRLPHFLKSSWLQKQPNSPRILHSDPLQEMKKLLKYYPKKISSLKAITLAYFSEKRFEEEEAKRIYRKILSKYPKYMFRYLCLNLDQPEMDYSSPLFLKTFRHLQILYVYCHGEQTGGYQHIPSLLKWNKCLSRVLLEVPYDHEEESIGFSIRWLRYLQKLRSFQINEIPIATVRQWKRAVPKVEILTFFGWIYQENLELLKQSMEGISQLAHLKKLNCECSVSDVQILKTIPFQTFETKNTLCDFRIHSSDRESDNLNLEALSQIDFLGISSKAWDSWIPLTDTLQMSSANLQRQSKNLLLIEGAQSFLFDILLKSCSNITTLDLFLSGEKENECSLVGIQNLCNLRNLSLKICDYNDGLAKNFKTLADHAKVHQKLSYLSLYLKSGKVTDRNSKDILLFFDTLKDTLTTLLFKSIPSDDKSLESIYTKISSFKNLKSLYLDCKYSSKSVQKSMPDLLKSLTSESLEELDLSIDTDIDAQLLEPSFAQSTKLTKLILKAKSFEKSLKLFNAFSSNLTELKELELILEIFPKRDWNTLARVLVKLSNIELLKIRSQDKPLLKIDEIEIQELVLKHQSLKLVALGNLEFLKIIMRKNYSPNIESFLCRFKQGLLDHFDHKISYI